MKTFLFTVIFLGIAAGSFVLFDVFDFQGDLGASPIQIEQTRISIETGKVLINNTNATDNQPLSKGDTITTFADTKASILFFDNSVSRIQPETILEISALDSETFLVGAGKIQLTLKTGEIWSNVQKQVSEDFSFGVNTRKINATVRGSSLNVFERNGITTVEAVEHSAQITSTDTELEIDNLIHEGEQIIIEPTKEEPNESKPYTSEPVQKPKLYAVRVIPISQEEKTGSWYSYNEQKDLVHEKKIVQKQMKAQKEIIGALPGTFGYKVKTLKDTFDLTIAPEEQKDALRLKIADRTLMESEILWNENKGDIAETQAIQARTIIEDIAKKSLDRDIQKQVQQTITKGKIRTRHILPGDDTYKSRELFREIEHTIAPENEKEKLKQWQLEKAAIDVHDLQKQEESETPQVIEIKERLQQQYTNPIRSNSQQPTVTERYLSPAPKITVPKEPSPESEENQNPKKTPTTKENKSQYSIDLETSSNTQSEKTANPYDALQQKIENDLRRERQQERINERLKKQNPEVTNTITTPVQIAQPVAPPILPVITQPKQEIPQTQPVITEPKEVAPKTTPEKQELKSTPQEEISSNKEEPTAIRATTDAIKISIPLDTTGVNKPTNAESSSTTQTEKDRVFAPSGTNFQQFLRTRPTSSGGASFQPSNTIAE